LATLARGEHALHRWQARHPLRVVSWPAESYDPFLNVNTREDLAAAEAIAARLAAAQPRRFA
jgi:molybdopterin-guanine dinucleotide biosynthesis protein A